MVCRHGARAGMTTAQARRFRRWLRYVAKPQPWPQRWQDRLFRGHVTIGRVTLYGANAMHWALNVWWLGHYWCVHPTTHTYGGTWPWYAYISKDATPQGACWIRKGGYIEGHAPGTRRGGGRPPDGNETLC